MKISKTSAGSSSCHQDQSNNDKFGCFEDCTGNSGSITGDYLLIPGGIYVDGGSNSQGKMYKNDYYCGEGLAIKDGIVRSNMPGPVTLRSGYI